MQSKKVNSTSSVTYSVFTRAFAHFRYLETQNNHLCYSMKSIHTSGLINSMQNGSNEQQEDKVVLPKFLEWLKRDSPMPVPNIPPPHYVMHYMNSCTSSKS